MRRITLMSLLLVGLLAAPVAAAPVIQVGTWYLLPGMEREFPIVVSSAADMVEGMDFVIQIGAGGPLNGGSDTWPKITQLSVVGAGLVFNQNVQDYIVGPLYDEILDITDPLIWRARVRMTRGFQTLASGTLAQVTLKADGTGELERVVRLTGVAAGYDPPGLDTNFGVEPFPTVLNGVVRVWQPHPLTWILPVDGNWTNPDAWDTGSYPAHYPNCTVMAIVNSPRKVSVHGVQEAYSLTVAAGEVAVTPGAELSLLSASSVAAGGKLSVAGQLQAAGPLTNHGTFELAPGVSISLDELLGSGTTSIAAGAVLTVDSVYQGTINVGGAAGSPGRLVFRSATGAPLGASADGPWNLGSAADGISLDAATVPEPSTLALVLTIACGLCAAGLLRKGHKSAT